MSEQTTQKELIELQTLDEDNQDAMKEWIEKTLRGNSLSITDNFFQIKMLSPSGLELVRNVAVHVFPQFCYTYGRATFIEVKRNHGYRGDCDFSKAMSPAYFRNLYDMSMAQYKAKLNKADNHSYKIQFAGLDFDISNITPNDFFGNEHQSNEDD